MRFIITIQGYETRNRIRTAKTFYVTKVTWGKGDNINKYWWSADRVKAMTFAKFMAERLTEQIITRFRNQAAFEPEAKKEVA